MRICEALHILSKLTHSHNSLKHILSTVIIIKPQQIVGMHPSFLAQPAIRGLFTFLSIFSDKYSTYMDSPASLQP